MVSSLPMGGRAPEPPQTLGFSMFSGRGSLPLQSGASPARKCKENQWFRVFRGGGLPNLTFFTEPGRIRTCDLGLCSPGPQPLGCFGLDWNQNCFLYFGCPGGIRNCDLTHPAPLILQNPKESPVHCCKTLKDYAVAIRSVSSNAVLLHRVRVCWVCGMGEAP